MKVLYVATTEIQLLDIPRELLAMGYDVSKAELTVRARGFWPEDCEKLVEIIKSSQADCTVSYDFIESIAQACLEADIPYIAWVYDAPQTELYTHYAKYPCNYIYVFDRMQRKRLQEVGVETRHTPLAVSADQIKRNLQGVQRNYRNEIAFVGSLYHQKPIMDVMERADEKVKAEIEQYMEGCLLRWSPDVKMHGVMGEACVDYFSEVDQYRTLINFPYITEQFYYEAAVLSRLLANRERLEILNTLAEDHSVTLYTNDKELSQLSDRVRVMPGVKYDTEVYEVYYNSKINLNVTLHCIETGVSQRVFDVMAAGGFMLSNYQEELEELFVPGEEIVLYHDMEELKELVDYYLCHDEEREAIAARGRKKVLEQHNYKTKLSDIMKFIEDQEKKRRESYLEMQAEFLREQAGQLLAEKQYEQLVELFVRREFATAIQNNADLTRFSEMLGCWQREQKVGKACVFEDVGSVEQAQQKYFSVKQGIDSIVQRKPAPEYTEALQNIHNECVSKLFLAWVAYSEFARPEKAYAALADSFWSYGAKEVLELISYALLFLPDNDELFMQKASCLMELQQWREALVTLRRISEPDQTVREIIEELENALGGGKSSGT